MTIADFEKLTEGLPKDMPIALPVGDNLYLTACNSTSRVVNIEFKESGSMDMLVLHPCFCNIPKHPVVECPDPSMN